MFARVKIQREFGKQSISFNISGEQDMLGVIALLAALLDETCPETGTRAEVEYIEHTPENITDDIANGK